MANELSLALNNIDFASERARAAILSGSVGVVIQNMGSTDPSLSLPLAMSDLERATERMMTALLGVRDDERELVKWSIIARGRVMEVQAEAEQVVVGTFDYIDKLMTHTYPNENDPSAIRARNTLHTRAASLHNKASRVFESFGAIRSDWRELDVRPTALRVGVFRGQLYDRGRQRAPHAEPREFHGACSAGERLHRSGGALDRAPADPVPGGRR